jgi:hypothetical protein
MKTKLRAVGAISFLSSSSIVPSLCFWRRSKWLQGILTLGRSSFFLCFPSSLLFVSAFFPLLLFFFLSICLSPLCYCFESGKTSSLCFCSWSSFLQSSALSVLVMKKSVQCWLLLSKLGLLFCSVCGLRFIGS